MSPRARRERRRLARETGRAHPPPGAHLTAWLDAQADLLFVGLLVFALGLRVYYFTLTKDQPLWWDEAEYMLKAKALALGTPDTGWWTARPVLLSFFAAGLITIGLGEATIKVVWLVLSVATLGLVYRLAVILFNKRVGVAAVALASVSYLDVFYSLRLLVDGPQVFFATLAAYLLVSSLQAEDGRHAAWGVVPALVVGTALRFTAAIFFPIAAAFLLAVKGMAALRARAWYVSVGLGVLLTLPMLLYFYLLYGNPFRPFVSHMVLRGPLATTTTTTSPTDVFMDYVRYMPNYTTPVVTAIFVVGLVQAIVGLVRGIRRLRQDRRVQGDLLMLLWIVVPFLAFGFFVNTFEDRFLIIIFPAVFLVTAAALDSGYVLLGKLSPLLGVAAVAGVVLYGGYEMAAQTDALIRAKIPSFRGVADAGTWIKQHAPAGAAILSSSVTQNTYYSERPTYNFAGEERELAGVLQDRAPSHMVVSLWERSPEWVYEWPKRNPDKVSVAAVFYLDESRQQPSAIVYAFTARATDRARREPK